MLHPLLAQRGGGDWMNAGYDTQRSSWVRGDGKIAPQTMAKPGGFQFLWKVKVKNAPRQTSSLTSPALLDFYIGYRGFRTLGFLSGSSGAVIAIDTDLGRLEWEKQLGAPSGGGTAQCPGGITSAVARRTVTGYPPAVGLRGFGRGGPAKGGVGEPMEGAVTLKERPVQFTPPPPPGKGPNARRTAAAPNLFAPRAQYVDVISADGKLHSMYVSNGEEPNAAIAFLPAGANAQGLMVFDGNAYAATMNGCGGADNGVWALNLESKKVTQWKSKANLAGSGLPAASPDGTLYVTAGTEIVALEEGTLAVKATAAPGGEFTTSPVIFELGGKDIVAAVAGGKLLLFDTALKPVGSGELAGATGALASYLDDAGVRWILAAAGGKIAAVKVAGQGGSPAVAAGWTSRDIPNALPPMVINGVIFAVAGGQGGGRATLYALDGNGKEVYSSGTAITGMVRTGGLAAGGGRVYVGGHDGTQYAFGFPMEH